MKDAQTYLGYKNDAGEEIHCANVFCPHADKCRKGCCNRVAMTPAQDATALADKFAHGDVNAVQFNLGPDRNFETRFWPTIGGARVRNADTPDDGYSTHAEALVAAARYRNDCRALRSTPSASAGPQAEAVAWRWKPKHAHSWVYDPDAEWLEAQSLDTIDVEPLYAHPQPQQTADAFANAAEAAALADGYPHSRRYQPEQAEAVAMWQWRCFIAGRWGGWIPVDDPINLRNGDWKVNFENGTAEMRPLYAHPQPQQADGRGAVIDAFEAGALAVHREWLAAHDRGEGPPRGDPEFGEAARDYALSQAPATDQAK